MRRLEAGRPAQVEWGQNPLFQPLEDIGHAAGQVIVEDDDTGVIIVQIHLISGALQGFQGQATPRWQRNLCGCFKIRQHGADTYGEAGTTNDIP